LRRGDLRHSLETFAGNQGVEHFGMGHPRRTLRLVERKGFWAHQKIVGISNAAFFGRLV
jgi:hypothetical protein